MKTDEPLTYSLRSSLQGGSTLGKLSQFTPEEYQKIMLETGSVKHFALFLGITDEEVKDLMWHHDIKLPPDYVRSLEIDHLLARLVIHGSFAQLAIELGVSQSFLKQQLRRRTVQAKYQEAKPRFTKQQFERELQRIGSIRMMARFYETTQDHIRKYGQRFGSNMAELVDSASNGYNSGKGNRAQNFFKEKRSSVLKDMNELLGPTAPYDFEDMHFNRVNVKASRPFKYKAKSRAKMRYWKFSTAGCKEADTFCLMFYDVTHSRLEYCLFVTAKSIAALGKKTITITEPNVLKQNMDLNSIHEIDLLPSVLEINL